MKILIKSTVKVLSAAALCLVLLGLVLFYSHSIYYNSRSIEPITVNQQDLIIVDGPIRDLKEQAKQLITQVRQGKKTVYLLINSPGGYVNAGDYLIKHILAAQSFGTEVVCIVDGMAASMATIILSRCDERLALFGSVIMWHSVMYRGLMTLNETRVEAMMRDLAMLNETQWHHTRKWFYPWFFRKHFLAETLLTASEVEANSFGFLRVINKITVIPAKQEKVPEVKKEKAKAKPKLKRKDLKKSNYKIAPMQIDINNYIKGDK